LETAIGSAVNCLVYARAVPSTVQIGEHKIGVGHPCFVIAEVGVNHNGDVELAHRLVDVAADIGADAVKFQTFTPELLAAPTAPKAEYQTARDEAPNQAAMLRNLALSRADHEALKAHAESRGLVFLSSVFDLLSLQLLDDLNVLAIKVPSGELTNLELLAKVAATGRPVIMSTGMATLVDVETAMAQFHDQAGVVILHCVSDYPAAPADSNLRAMDTLRERFGVPVGWSDHTAGAAIAPAAVALGADVIEKHLTLDTRMPGPDHAASLEPAAFEAMVVAIREVQSALGSGQKMPTASERVMADVARKSLHWNRDLQPGDLIADGDFVALRPGTGIPPSEGPLLLGRRVRKPTRRATLVRTEEIEPTANRST